MLLRHPAKLATDSTSTGNGLSMKRFQRLAFVILVGIATGADAQPSVQVGFSPEGSARALVLETIGGAKQSIQMLAYAFQAPDIAQALVAAQQRGVRVRVVIDKKRNRGKTSRAAMDFVTRGGVELRTNDRYHIHHDKTMIVDGSIVQTGSFNYAPSAETLNSENVVVIRDDAEVARQYLEHWQLRWDQGVAYRAK